MLHKQYYKYFCNFLILKFKMERRDSQNTINKLIDYKYVSLCRHV